jgi:PAS domain S-box-containing protein
VSELWVEVGELVQAINEPAVVVEFRDGELHIVVANAAAGAAFGQPVPAILGTGFAAFYRPDERAELERRVREVIETRRATSHDVTRELPAGRFVVHSWLAPLPGGRVLGIGRDHSVRSAALERATDLERLTGTGTWTWNLVDDSVRWSTEFRRVLDLSDDLVPDPEAAFGRIHPDDVDAVRCTFAQVQRRGRTAEIECRVRWCDGSERRIVARAALVRDADGLPVRLVGTVHDVTEQRRLERREQQAATAARQLDRALQLNDDVVQALARATLALQLGRLDEVQSGVRDGMAAVRTVMGELLRSTTASGGGLRSGDLRRRGQSSAPMAGSSREPPR